MRLFLLFAMAASVQAQTFDAASVKALDSPFIETVPKRSPGRISWTTDMLYLLGYAFQLQPFQLEGPIPGSAAKHVYRIDAPFPADTSEDQFRRMLQNLLVERFKIQSHHRAKEANVYSLTVAKGGAKIQPAADDAPAPPFPDWWKNPPSAQAVAGRLITTVPAAGMRQTAGWGVTMAQLCSGLGKML